MLIVNEMQIREALKSGKEKLIDSDSAGLDAELLLCSVLNCERGRLYSAPEKELSNETLKAFNNLTALRAQGHPIAYLTHKKEFWSLDLEIKSDTFIPRPETELLVEILLTVVPKAAGTTVLDLGTGIGAVAIAIASERPLTKITAIDKCNHALDIAKRNAQKHKIKNITFKQTNWNKPGIQERFDVIVSNPPYLSTGDPHLQQGDVRFEPLSALVSGQDGLDDITTIISKAKKQLNNKGWLLLEHGFQQAPAVRKLFKENHFSLINTFKDYSGLERVSFGQWVLDDQ